MSDHKTKSIQDRGWNAMHSILEKELPVKEKKRLVGLWFILGSMIIASLLFWIFYLLPGTTGTSIIADENSIIDHRFEQEYESEKKPESLSNESKETPFVDQQNTEANAEERNNAIYNKAFNQANEQELKKENISAPSTNARRSTIFKTKNPNDGIINIQKPKPLSNLSIIQNFQENTSQLPKIYDQKNNDNKESILLQETQVNDRMQINMPIAETVKPERALLEPLFHIPASYPTSLSTKNAKNIVLNRKIDVTKENTFSPYLFATANYQRQSSGVGYGLGAGLSYGSNNLSIYLESSYLKSTFNNGTSSEELAADASVIEVEEGATGNSGVIVNTNFDLNVSTFSNLTAGTDELRIDLGLRKRLSNKFKIDFGLGYSRLLNATNQSLNVEFNASASDLDRIFYQVNSSELFDSGAYSAYDIVPHIGFEYTLMSNVYLNLHYNYGLKNLIGTTTLERLSSSSLNDEIYRRNIGIKIRYDF